MTIEDLANEFYSNYMVHRLRPSTCRGYMVNINNHILPFLTLKFILLKNPIWC